jgi:hypothetical protein
VDEQQYTAATALPLLQPALVAASLDSGLANPLNTDNAIRVGELVRRDGLAVLAFHGTDAGQDGTGLRLASLGKIRDAHGQDLYTVWRVLNSSGVARTVTLYAPQVTGRTDTSFRRVLALQPRTETIVRSIVVAWPAMHLMSEGVRLIDVRNACAIVYDSPRTIADPRPHSPTAR